jgi:hypothetical protein
LGGEYSDHWEDEEDNRKINIKIKLPDKVSLSISSFKHWIFYLPKTLIKKNG